MKATHTLLLTRGTHAISSEAREAILDAILDAIRAGEPLVEVQVDLFGADTERLTTIVTAHVIAIAENPPPVAAEPPQPTTRCGKTPATSPHRAHIILSEGGKPPCLFLAR
jgi:hypothetical protein